MQAKILARSAVAVVSVISLGLASYYTLRLAVADQHYRANTLADLSRAVELDPLNARMWTWLAEHQEHAGLDSTAALRTAASLSPFDAAPKIRLGLRAELAGQLDLAEKFLLQAARIDNLFQPRWSLVNFYFRTGNEQKFWQWTRSALDMGYGDLSPLYRLCWRFSSDADLILSHIPDRRPILAGYLDFLLTGNRVSSAAPVAQRLIPLASLEDMPLLVGYVDQSLDLAAWNALCRRGLLPYHPLSPDSGPVLTNADFRNPPLLQGFDWRVTNTAEISAAGAEAGGLRITLSGNQPEFCELLSQPIPLVPGRRYRFRFDYRTTQVAPNTGMRWSIGDRSTPDLSSADFKTEILDFSAKTPRARLALHCRRVPGETRIEGSVFLRNLALDPLP